MLRWATSWKNHFIDFFVGTNDLIEIRTDLLGVYKSVLKNPKIKPRVNKSPSYWYSRAIEKGVRAEYVDPHKKVLQLVSILQWGISIAAGIAMGVLSYVILDISVSKSLIITLSPSSLLKCYSWALSRDTELFQEVNKKLRFKNNELQRFKRNLYDIATAAIWNGGLLDPVTLIVLEFLRVLKVYCSPLYKLVLRGLKNLKIQGLILDENKSFKGKFFELCKWQFQTK